MHRRSGILLWTSLKLSVWKRRAINILFVIPRLFLMLMNWQWLTFHLPSKTLRLFQTFFSETFANPIIVYTIFSHRLKIQLWHPVSGSQLYTQGQSFALKDIVLQCLTASLVFSSNVSDLHTLTYTQFYCGNSTPTFVVLRCIFCILLRICLLCNCVIKLS